MKKLIVLITVFLVSLFTVAQVFANNDPKVPADECSANEIVVGQPDLDGDGKPNNAVDRPLVSGVSDDVSPVNAQASVNNPGQSTGALGQTNSEAIGNCAATK